MYHQEKKEAGRVVDLKRMTAGKDDVAKKQKPEKKKRDWFFIFRFGWFKKPDKGHRVDFLKHYKNLEKKEDFIEREILKEYLNDDEEDEKRGILISFFHFLTAVIKLWWLPLFLIRFIWILFWRIFKLIFFRKKKHAGEKKRAAVKEERLIKTEGLSKLKIPKKLKDKGGVMSFLFGRREEDYLLEVALLEEIKQKKFSPWRHFLTFGLLLFLIILPLGVYSFYNVVSVNDLRGRVLGVSELAIGDLRAAVASVSGLDLQGAEDNFAAARENFSEASDGLREINGLLFELGKIIPNDKIRLAAESREIMAAGTAAASLGKNLSLALNGFFQSDGRNLSEMLDNFTSYESYAFEDAKYLNEEIAKIDIKILPTEYQEKFLQLKEKSADLEDILFRNIELVKKINVFLGSESDKRYLFVFENNSEMRATGGFIGSYALVDFSQGKVKNIEAPGGGSYDTEGGLRTSVIAPEPLYLVNPLWHFWDANWWPDWKKSADKLSWFYEKSGGPTTDGVIAFTPTVLERILAVIGPIDMNDASGTIMTSENLWENLRTIIENEKTADNQLPYEVAENKPKRIIGELMQKIMEEIPARMDKEKLTKLLYGLEADLNEKQILMYFKNDNLQKEAEARNWAGRIKETNKDYLAVVNTNIAGGKSDRKMEEIIKHEAEVRSDGSIIDTVTITRMHIGVKDEFFSGVRNVNWMRVYVPLGSELLLAEGFRGPDPVYFSLPEEGWQIDQDVAAEEGDRAVIDHAHLNTKIYTEDGKTVFANWSMIDPGDNGVIRLKYKLPFKLEKKAVVEEPKTKLEAIVDKFVAKENEDRFVYSLLVQKQAGSLFTSVSTELKLPEDFKIVWKHPFGLETGNNSWKDSGKLDKDKYWAVITEKNNN